MEKFFLKFIEIDQNANGYYVLKNQEAFKEFLKKEIEIFKGVATPENTLKNIDYVSKDFSMLNTVNILSKIDLKKEDLSEILGSITGEEFLFYIKFIPGIAEYLSDKQKEEISQYEAKLQKLQMESKEQKYKEEQKFYNDVIQYFKEDFKTFGEMKKEFSRSVIKTVFDLLDESEQ